MKKGMVKTPDEIAAIKRGGELLSRVLGKLAARVKPGVTTAELDDLAEKEILKAGGRPAFKGYKIPGVKVGFNSTVCTSINDEVVHAPAHPDRTLKEGDIIGLDIGMQHPAADGYFTDMAISVPVGNVSKEAARLMAVTREAMDSGLGVIRAGMRTSQIGLAVQQHVEKHGFGVVRDLVGHGVGYAVHEDPKVPNYYDPGMPDTVLKTGMVLAVEPMVTAGDWHVDTLPDEWTVVTQDKSLAAHFEVTVAVTDDGIDILTPLPI